MQKTLNGKNKVLPFLKNTKYKQIQIHSFTFIFLVFWQMQFTRQIQYLHSRLAPDSPIETFIDAVKPKAIGLSDKSQFYAPVRFSVQICGGINAPAGAIRVDVPVHANENWLADMKSRFAGMIGLKNALSNVDISFKTVNGIDISTLKTEELPRVGKLNVFVGDKKVRLPNMPQIPVEYSVCKEANIQSWLSQVASELPELIAQELCKCKTEAEINRAVRGDGNVVKMISAKAQALAAQQTSATANGWSDFLRTHHMNSPDSISPQDAEQTLSLISTEMLGNVRRFIEASDKPISAYLQSLEAKQLAQELSSRDGKEAEHYKPLFKKVGTSVGANEMPINAFDMYHKIAEDALASPIVHQSVIATIYNRPIDAGCRWTKDPDTNELRKMLEKGGKNKNYKASATTVPSTSKRTIVTASKNSISPLVDDAVATISRYLQTANVNDLNIEGAIIPLLDAAKTYNVEQQTELFKLIFKRLQNTTNIDVAFSGDYAIDQRVLDYSLSPNEEFPNNTIYDMFNRFLIQLDAAVKLKKIRAKQQASLVFDEKTGVLSWTRSFNTMQDAIFYLKKNINNQSRASIAGFWLAYRKDSVLEKIDQSTLDKIAYLFNVTNTVDAVDEAIDAYVKSNEPKAPETTSSGRSSAPPKEPIPQKYEFDWPDEEEGDDPDYNPDEEDDLTVPNRKARDKPSISRNQNVAFPNPKITSKGTWIQFMRDNFTKFATNDWYSYLYDAPVSKKGLIAPMTGAMFKSFIKDYMLQVEASYKPLAKGASLKKEKENVIRVLQNAPRLTEISAHHPWNAQIHHTLQPLADGAYPAYYNLLHTKQDMSKNANYNGDLAETYKAYHMFAGLPISPPGLLIEKRARSRKGAGRSHHHAEEEKDNKHWYMKSELQPIECGSCGGHKSDSDSDSEDDKQKKIKSRIGSAMPPLVPLRGTLRGTLQPVECGSNSDSEDEKFWQPTKSSIIPPRPPLIRLDKLQAKMQARMVPISNDTAPVEDEYANEDIGETFGLPTCSDVFGD